MMMKRRTSIKLTSRRSSSATTPPTIARSFGFEQSFETRWDCSRKLKELYDNHPLRFDKSPIFTRKRPTTVSISEVPPEVRAEQKVAEQKIHLLKDLPWNTKPTNNKQEEKPTQIQKTKKNKLKRNETMPTKKSSWIPPREKRSNSSVMRSLEDISFPPPPSPTSLKRYMGGSGHK